MAGSVLTKMLFLLISKLNTMNNVLLMAVS